MNRYKKKSRDRELDINTNSVKFVILQKFYNRLQKASFKIVIRLSEINLHFCNGGLFLSSSIIQAAETKWISGQNLWLPLIIDECYFDNMLIILEGDRHMVNIVSAFLSFPLSSLYILNMHTLVSLVMDKPLKILSVFTYQLLSQCNV